MQKQEYNRQQLSDNLTFVDNKVDNLTIKNYNNYIGSVDDSFPSVGQYAHEFGSWNKAKKIILGKGDIRKILIYSLDYTVGKVKEANEVLENITYENVKEWCNENDIKFPSINYMQKHFGGWGNIKSKVVEYKSYPEFCENCGIGRCRFDYNLDKCEYYEGE